MTRNCLSIWSLVCLRNTPQWMFHLLHATLPTLFSRQYNHRQTNTNNLTSINTLTTTHTPPFSLYLLFCFSPLLDYTTPHTGSFTHSSHTLSHPSPIWIQTSNYFSLFLSLFYYPPSTSEFSTWSPILTWIWTWIWLHYRPFNLLTESSPFQTMDSYSTLNF